MADAAYRGMSADELNRQYSARDAVPGHLGIFERWRRLSADFRARARTELNVSYGPKPRNAFDLFLPEGDGPFPTHVYIHGGYWQSMDKNDQSFLATALVNAGVAVAVPNYTLCPDISVSGIVEEVRDAVAGLYRHGSRLRCDPDRIHVSGHSAGGHLVGMLMATDWPARAGDLPRTLVKSGLSISGVFDLEALVPTKINVAPGLTAEEARTISPMFLEPFANAPLALVVGGEETDEFHRQSNDLAQVWGVWLSRVESWSAPGLNHFTVAEALADSRSRLFETAREFALA